jgi:hypothetical protein
LQLSKRLSIPPPFWDFARAGCCSGGVKVSILVAGALLASAGGLFVASRPAGGARPAAAATTRGPLIAVTASPGRRGVLVRLRRRTLRAVSPGLSTSSRFAWDYEFSPNRRVLALGDEARSRILLFDVRGWRALGGLRLPSPHPGGYGGAGDMVWVAPRRLLVLAGPPLMSQIPVVVDPVERRVVRRIRWQGWALTSDEAADGLVLLAPPPFQHGHPQVGPARLVYARVDGRVTSVRLDRIEAGEGQGDDGRGRAVYPGLAVDRHGGRAFAVAADQGLVAEVDLRTSRVAYHDLLEPAAAAKGGGGSSERFSRIVRWLGEGMLAVAGEDIPASEPPHRARLIPFGLRLVDTHDWTVRTVDREAQTFDLAGPLLLARRWHVEQGLRPMGVAAYDLNGSLRWRRFAGASALVQAPGGPMVYIDVGDRGKRRTHVVELATGRTIRVLPYMHLSLLRN